MYSHFLMPPCLRSFRHAYLGEDGESWDGEQWGLMWLRHLAARACHPHTHVFFSTNALYVTMRRRQVRPRIHLLLDSTYKACDPFSLKTGFSLKTRNLLKTQYDFTYLLICSPSWSERPSSPCASEPMTKHCPPLVCTNEWALPATSPHTPRPPRHATRCGQKTAPHTHNVCPKEVQPYLRISTQRRASAV